MNKIVIAVDGFSSCGKSTLAKQLAKTLNYIFVDSGAMYRAITLYFLENNIRFNDTVAIERALKNIQLKFEYVAETGKSDMLLNGVNVEQQIREMRISENVSPVATIEAVRTFAVAAQQQMGKEKGLVMDGRDIGTTVFPDAELKIFVTANTDVRVERRWLELQAKGEQVSKDEVKKNLLERDHIDTTRAISPLQKAADAIVLDNSNLTREQQLALALQWAKERM
ncbi:MAG: (d)CMP kinase [Sphingobacteriia bacterium]|nr:(d)CMP kinase [Sphingobacteriia bacterium]